MPPFRDYWLPYVLFALSLGVLGWAFRPYFDSTVSLPTTSGPVLLAGVTVAFASVVAATWTGWRSSRMQHTMTALQSLRTDREYLEAAKALQRQVPEMGKPISPALVAALLNPPAGPESETEILSFPDSVKFILNQYEFLAVAVRKGVMDEDMLRETIRGSVCGLVESFAPYIREVRTERPARWENLVWLYQRFTRKRSFDLPAIGPLRRPTWPNQ